MLIAVPREWFPEWANKLPCNFIQRNASLDGFACSTP
jgi:hypothetical protein